MTKAKPTHGLATLGRSPGDDRPTFLCRYGDAEGQLKELQALFEVASVLVRLDHIASFILT